MEKIIKMIMYKLEILMIGFMGWGSLTVQYLAGNSI